MIDDIDHARAAARPGERTSSAADRIYRAAAHGHPCWARDDRGAVMPLPIARWMGWEHSTQEDRDVDAMILRRCVQSPVLDVGCGPGRFTAALHESGIDALGIDTSLAAVDLTRTRGAVAIRQDVFSPLVGEGSWAHVLVTDGNIGIGGDPSRLLRRAAELLAPQGTVIADIDRPGTPRGAMQRWENASHVGDWFPWAHIDLAMLTTSAADAGFDVVDVDEANSRAIVVMRRR